MEKTIPFTSGIPSPTRLPQDWSNHSASLTTQTQLCCPNSAIQKKNICSLTRRDTVPKAQRSNKTRWWRDSFQRRRDRRGATNFPPRVVAPDDHCSTEKAGDTGREGNAVFTLEAIAIRCTASLRKIANHLGLPGVIPLPLPATRSRPSA